jgi:hypothetical protein
VHKRPVFFFKTTAFSKLATSGPDLKVQTIFTAAIVQRIDIFAGNDLSH